MEARSDGKHPPTLAAVLPLLHPRLEADGKDPPPKTLYVGSMGPPTHPPPAHLTDCQLYSVASSSTSTIIDDGPATLASHDDANEMRWDLW